MPNAAQRLHDLVAEAKTHNAVASAAWAEVLGAAYGTADFVQRYAEVWGLLSESLRLVAALPSASQPRYLKYSDAWLHMLATPGGNWNSTALDINEPALDQLGALGDLAESILFGTALVPTGGADLQALREQCAEWLTVVDEFDDLPKAAREELKAQLRHLLWLIDNVSTFGVSRVTQEARATEGTLRAHEERLSGDRLTGWRQKAGAFSVALVMVTGGLTTGAGALDAGVSVIQQTTELRDAVDELISPSDEDVVDGEVVNGELPPGRS